MDEPPVPTYYEILGVDVDAPYEAIQAVFRHRSREAYPRRPGAGNPDLQKKLNQAYSVLRDPEKRKAYNLELGILTPPRSIKPPQNLYDEILISPELARSGGERPFTFSRREPCLHCLGRGCIQCDGRGELRQRLTIAVSILPGAREVLVEGEGLVGEFGGKRGDLVLYVVVEGE